MDRPTNGERLASLETDNDHIQSKLDKVEHKVDLMNAKIDLVVSAQNKQKGFIAGVMFVVVPLWTIVVTFAKGLWDWYMNGGDAP